MSTLSVLRKLAERQQYLDLIEAGTSCWAQSQDLAILPLLAQAHAHLGERQRANEILVRAFGSSRELDGYARVDAAAALVVLQRVNEAIPLLEQALVEEPNYALGLARLGYCRMLQMDLASAQVLLQQAADIEPERLPVLVVLAQVHLLQTQLPLAQVALEKGREALSQSLDELPTELYQQYWHQLNGMQFQLWVAVDDFASAEQRLEDLALEHKEGHLEERDFVMCLERYSRLLAERNLQHQAEDILREYLRQFPQNVSLHMQLAELAQVQGRFMQAASLLRRALRQDEGNIGLWVRLSTACLHRFDKKARRAAERAVELAEALEADEDQPISAIGLKRAQARNALARVECHEQKFAEAEQRFRDILSERGQFLPALQGLGQLHMQRGNIDAALEIFDRIKRIDPVRGHSALINARRFPEDIETLERMEQAAQVPSLEGPVRTGILFQLAAAWEKRRVYDKAFEFATQANEASRKRLTYDREAHRNRCARIRMGFCSALYEHRRDCGVSSILPVYVLGMPRSGTTLVEQIISGHSHIFGAGELGLIPQVVQGLNRWERHVGSGRGYPDCVDDVTPYVSAGIAENVLKELREYAPDAKHVIDKLPHNFENIGLIKFLFPNAKIISVRRDPRDVAISNYFMDYQAKHSGMGFAYDLTAIGEQLADHNLLMHHWHQVFPGEILEVNYEDVVDDLEGSARRMLDYIGVGWEPQVLKFNELDRTVKTASVWQVRQPIYRSSKARWVHYKEQLRPLIEGTNAKICPDECEMLTLREPGLLSKGVELYRQDDLDGAELSLKKMLHHNPDHAACNYLVGLVYLRKGHALDGIEKIERAVNKAPFRKEWRRSLAEAYRVVGDHDTAAKLEPRHRRRGQARAADEGPLLGQEHASPT